MAASLLVVTGCNNYVEDTSAPEDAGTAALQHAATEVINEAGQQLSGLQFDGLDAVGAAFAREAQVLQEQEDMEGQLEAGEAQTRAAFPLNGYRNSQVFAKLGQLVTMLRGDFDRTYPYGRQFSVHTFSNILSLAWDINGTMMVGRTLGSPYFKNSYNTNAKLDFRTFDGVSYSVIAEKGVSKSANQGISNESTRLLKVYQDGTLLLSVESQFSGNRAGWSQLLYGNLLYSGHIVYKDYDLSMSFGREDMHNRTIQLAISTTDSETPVVELNFELADNLNIASLINRNVVFSANIHASVLGGVLAIDAKVDNLMQMAQKGIYLYKYYSEGTSEEQCTSATEVFNKSMTLNLSMGGSSFGEVYLMPQYDIETGNFKPAMMTVTPMFGPEPVPLLEVLDAMGMSIDEVLNALKAMLGNE